MKSFCETLISKPDAKEAREWLQSARKRRFTLGELDSTQKSLALVEKAYASGAVRVTAVEIVEYPEMGGGQNTGKLVIELPDAGSNRAKVLAWASKIAEEQGFDALSDTGERYVFVMLD
jgi:hypothetical protein